MVNLTDANGAVVASYSYDAWGNLTSSSESIPNVNGWVNPSRFDGRDHARYDASDGLTWLTTRAYDPTLGRFLARDPLGRVPLYFADNPYAYAGNNPLSNVDPSGQYRAAGQGSAARESGAATNKLMARVVAHQGCDYFCEQAWRQRWIDHANTVRSKRLAALDAQAQGDFIAAGFLDVMGLLLGFDAAVDVLDKLVDFADVVSVFLDILIPSFGKLGQDKGWSPTFYSKALTASAWLNQIMALVTATVAAVRLGGLAAMGVGIALGAIDTAAEGIPGLLVKLFGSFMAFVLQSAGAGLMAVGYATLEKEDHQQQMSITTWCKMYGGGACG